MLEPSIIRYTRALLAAILSVVLAVPAEARPRRATPVRTFAPFARPALELTARQRAESQSFEKLKGLIESTPIEKMDLKFFKQVYAEPQAPKLLKLVFGRPELEAKSSRLGELRKYYDWTIQAEYARLNHVVIENTNQGKDNGARSDLDATANVLEFDQAAGKWVVREKAVAGLLQYQQRQYKLDALAPEGVDVTLFNGDVWLPDWREVRMGYREFTRQLTQNTWELMQRKGAYFVPGAHREQAQDRALREGHSVHIGWDYVAGRPTINGLPVEFDTATGKVVWVAFDERTGTFKKLGPVAEFNTQEAAARGAVVRYQDLEGLPPGEAWRRAFGNIVQNTKEFFEPHDPVGRNKYFIERVIDQSVGRFTHLETTPAFLDGQLPEGIQPTYVQIHAADQSRLSAEEKSAWKRSFIQQGFGLKDGDPRIEEIRDVLDRSSEIQLDKTRKRAAYADRAQHGGAGYYYAGEWNDAVKNTEAAVRELREQAAQAGKPVPAEQVVKLQEREAERLFVEKQRRIIIEGTIEVAKQTFRRDFSSSPDASNARFSERDVAMKTGFERGVELALLMDLIESAPEISPAQREKLRGSILEAIPEASRALVSNLAELSRLKLGLIGSIRDPRSAGKPPSELAAEVMEEWKAKFPDSEGASSEVAESVVKQTIRGMIHESLGPVDAPKFEEAWKAGKTALIAKFGAQAYVNEMIEQADALMIGGAALGLVNAYQQHCIAQTSWNEECVLGLAEETGNQVMYLAPVFNTGWMIVGGLKSMGEGRVKEGAASLALGVFSIPPVAGMLGVSGAMFIHVYVAMQMARLAGAVTYGYAVQTMDNDAAEQAFKALREPGKQARAYVTPGRSMFTGDTPTVPLLADLIPVPADAWDDAERNRVTLREHGKEIDAQLVQMGLLRHTAEWDQKKRELVLQQAALLPYVQRTASIYKAFAPKVEAKLKELGKGEVEDLASMRDCLEFREEEVEKKYQAPASLWDRMHFWRDTAKQRQADLAAVWSGCVDKAAKDDAAILTPVFEDYLNGWLQQQNGSAQSQYGAREMRDRLRAALIREYVMHRHMDLGYENERQMKKTLAQSKQVSTARTQVMGKMLRTQKGLQQSIGDKFRQVAEANSRVAQPEVKPELTLRAPPFAVRMGETAYIDFAVRGQYRREDPAGSSRNRWNADLQGEVVKVTLARPDDLIVTRELEQELQSGPAKRFVTIEEKLTGVLRDGEGRVLAKAETVTHYFSLVEWDGRITVETRAATTENQEPSARSETLPYFGALVKLSGPAQSQLESKMVGGSDSLAGVRFQELPEGKFLIHVDPQPDDKHHRAAEATVTLAGLSTDTADGRPRLVWGNAEQSVAIVLPYVATPEPPRTARQQPNKAVPGKPGEPPAGPAGQPAGTPAPDIQRVADCGAFIGRARAALARHDLPGASSSLEQAQQAGCGGVPSVANDLNNLQNGITNAQADHNLQVQNATNAAGGQMAACNFEKALDWTQQLLALDPNNAWAAANLDRLRQVAAEQSRIRGLLAVSQGSLNAEEAAGLIAQLRESLANAPACMVPQINQTIQALQNRIAPVNPQALAGQISGLFEACDYVKALAVALQLQTVAPRDPWLAANLPRLQAVAAEQASALALIRAARDVTPEGAPALLAQLRQCLQTAPSCMAGPIQTAISGLERRAGQKPAWLDQGPSKPASTGSADDNIRQARIILQHTADEQQTLLNQRQQARTLAPPPGAPADSSAAPPAAPRPSAADEPARGKHPNAARVAGQLSGLLQTLPAIIANRGMGPIPPIPSGGGGAQATDVFTGTWVGYGAVTTHRAGTDERNGSIVDARVNPQENQIVFKIYKSGAGYVFENVDGRRATIRYINGNRIGVSARVAKDDGRSFTVTGDYEANGATMTGTQRGEGVDGSLIVMSVHLTRQ